MSEVNGDWQDDACEGNVDKGEGQIELSCSISNLSKSLKTEVQDTLNIPKRQVKIGCKTGYYQVIKVFRARGACFSY